MQDSKSRKHNPRRPAALFALAAGLIFVAGPAVAACEDFFTLEWIEIPGNPLDPNPPDPTVVDPDTLTPLGSVSLPYRITKHEITNAQYLAFLNAQACQTVGEGAEQSLGNDPNGLFNNYMSRQGQGIISSGVGTAACAYVYKNGFEQIADRPVGNVSYYDALRFANWVHNACPGFPSTNNNDVNLTTDRGAYSITPTRIANNTVVRSEDPLNPALVFLPNADEWHKAAFYDTSTQSYFAYPTSSNSAPQCLNPAVATPNSASCNRSYISLEPKAGYNVPPPTGSYPDSMSPYGALDMGGSIDEWTETSRYSFFKVIRGGSYTTVQATGLAASAAYPFLPVAEFNDIGFRLAGLIPVSAPAVPPLDTDQDGINDADDNCSLHPNPSQLDSNGDGYGNRCDADYNDDGTVGGPDFQQLAAGFQSQIGDSTYDPAVDCNGDGEIGGPDFECFVIGFRAGVPGPSGAQ